ncbi:MAG: 5-(carboxyamino)imidazole ribonucleotide synthase [Halobacteriota archaeon]
MTISVPGPTLGVVGGGQLGRMLAEAAAPLGVDVVVLDPTPECPASTVAADHVLGDFDDPEAVAELAERCDLLTVEIELADPDLLERASDSTGVAVHPTPDTLRVVRDKLAEKRALADAGIPVPEFRAVDDVDGLREALDAFGEVMLKAREGGYDGRGNVPVTTPEGVESALAEVGAHAVAESFVDFERELSVIGVKGRDEVRTFPVGENVHEAEILRETIVPARTRDDTRIQAEKVARDVLSVLDGRGVYGIELFETGEGDILVNEIAPRPHNSGHWTIEGAYASQFEQHVRATLGWPLGPTTLRSSAVMANILGDGPSRPARLHGVDEILSTPGAHLHWYGKDEVRDLRKMGHVTAVPHLGDDPAGVDRLLDRARSLRDGLRFASDTR